MPVSGAAQLRQVAADLKLAPAGMRRDLRRNLTAAVTPTVNEVKRNAFAIPAKGPRTTGLRVALMRATRARVRTTGRNIAVGVIVDGAKMPPGQSSLPGAVEGNGRPWRHPVFGTNRWVQQPSHPIVAPAIPGTVTRATLAVGAAIDATAKALTEGNIR